MTTRTKERFCGAFLCIASTLTTYLAWTVLAEGKSTFAIGLAGPAFFVLGVALILFPGYRTERLARGEDISHLSGWDLLTPRWKAVTGVALGATLLFYVLAVM